MFRRYRIAGLAFGLAVSIASCVQAQESQQTPQGQAASQENPAERAPFRFPVEIVEDQAETDARHLSEKQSDQREIDDLAAQQGMNSATKRMADYAYWQTWLVGVGTTLLIATLLLTLQANRAAVQGAESSAKSANAYIRAERPHMLISNLELEHISYDETDNYHFNLRWEFKNFGRSAAFIAGVSITHKLSFHDVFANNYATPVEYRHIIPPEGTLSPEIYPEVIVDDISRKMMGQGISIWVFGYIQYQDGFSGGQCTHRFCYRIGTERGRERFAPSDPAELWGDEWQEQENS